MNHMEKVPVPDCKHKVQSGPSCILQALGTTLAEDVLGDGNHRDGKEEEQVEEIRRGALRSVLIGWVNGIEEHISMSSRGHPWQQG